MCLHMWSGTTRGWWRRWRRGCHRWQLLPLVCVHDARKVGRPVRRGNRGWGKRSQFEITKRDGEAPTESITDGDVKIDADACLP